MTNLFPRTEEAPRQLRDYQEEAIERLRESLRSGKRRPLLQAPTGSGKTLLASTLIKMARAKGKRVVFTVPALSLIDQTLKSFWADGIGDVGVIQAQHAESDLSQPVQIASVQTLMRRPYPEADMVICDEAHKLFEFYGKWMCDPAWQKVPFIGLSATPGTKGLGKIYDDLITLTTTAELIDQGHLSPFRVFAPSHPDLKGVRTVAGDYHEGELSTAMNKAPLVADVVETWLKHGEGRPTLCFAVDRAHAKHLQQQFEAAGVSCGYQDMNTKSDERLEIKRKFHNGEYKVVTNCETLTVGVDWDVRCISLCRPTKSKMLFVQIIGRGLRMAEGKLDLKILDHSDNHLRLGFVTDIKFDHLHDGKSAAPAEKLVALPKECPKCSYLRPPRVSTCPNCGFKPETKAPPANQSGELQELIPGQKVAKPKGTAKIVGKTVVMHGRPIPFGEFFGELKSYARLHGYKPGWSAQKYKTAVGVWPNAYKDAPEMPVSMEVAAWVRSQAIRWAKSQAPR